VETIGAGCLRRLQARGACGVNKSGVLVETIGTGCLRRLQARGACGVYKSGVLVKTTRAGCLWRLQEQTNKRMTKNQQAIQRLERLEQCSTSQYNNNDSEISNIRCQKLLFR
jgi:hypothetical protein